MVVEEIEVDEVEGDGHQMDCENDGEASGDACAVISVSYFISPGGSGDALVAVAGDGMDALEKSVRNRAAFDGEGAWIHGGLAELVDEFSKGVAALLVAGKLVE